jgi:hypothetical protein
MHPKTDLGGRMGTTPVYQLPYPEPSDPADVPIDLRELADALEAKIAPGSATGQIPVWDNTSKRWVGQAKAPAATAADTAANADRLDNIDSTGFLQRAVAGAQKAWWTKATIGIGGGKGSVAHPLGVTPAVALANTDAATPLGGFPVQSLALYADHIDVFIPNAEGQSGSVFVFAVG